MSARAGHAFEIRKSIKREVYLPGRTPELVATNLVQEITRKLIAFDKVQKRESWIDAGGNHFRVDLIPIRQRHANRAAILHNDLRDGGFFSNFHAGFDRGFCNRIRDSPGAAAGKPPGPERAVDLSHVVVKQYIRRTWGANPQKSPDDSRSRH